MGSPERPSGIRMRESFEHFYLTKVGLGEGCGCAEHVTRIREIDAYANRGAGSTSTATAARPLAWLTRMFARWGSKIAGNRI
jgi:hypothetical protein